MLKNRTGLRKRLGYVFDVKTARFVECLLVRVAEPVYKRHCRFNSEPPGGRYDQFSRIWKGG